MSWFNCRITVAEVSRPNARSKIAALVIPRRGGGPSPESPCGLPAISAVLSISASRGVNYPTLPGNEARPREPQWFTPYLPPNVESTRRPPRGRPQPSWPPPIRAPCTGASRRRLPYRSTDYPTRTRLADGLRTYGENASLQLLRLRFGQDPGSLPPP